MSRPRLLVISVVHHSDDTRIREKSIRTLAEDWSIEYRTRRPGPTDQSDHVWRELRGGRLARNIGALAALLRGRYEAAVVHDPELVPAAVLARLIVGKRVVFDVHEHVPGQIATKDWVPARRAVSRISAWMLRRAEPVLDITLAEAGYQELFDRPHPVFPNYPGALPPVPRLADRASDEVVYVGSVTELRGVPFVIECLPAGSLFTVIGPCADDLAHRMRDRAQERGVRLQMLGRLPHRQALERAALGSVAVSPLFDIPNYRHSLPTKVLEYLSLGLPVLASDLPGTRDVVGAEPGVRLIPPEDESAWTSALSEVLESGAGEAVMPEAANEHRWPEETVRAFYAELLPS